MFNKVKVHKIHMQNRGGLFSTKIILQYMSCGNARETALHKFVFKTSLLLFSNKMNMNRREHCTVYIFNWA